MYLMRFFCNIQKYFSDEGECEDGGSHFNFTINSKNESCEHDTLIFDRSTVASSLVEDFGFVCE